MASLVSTPVANPLLVLASASPRRKELLSSLQINAYVCPADIDESRLNNESPQRYVERLAVEKAKAAMRLLKKEEKKEALKEPQEKIASLPILAADTIVTLDNQLFGKPKSYDDAIAIWQTLSGKTHEVMTAIALLTESAQYVALSTSKVSFIKLSEKAMTAYWETGEPVDKAGAYAIQGFASAWVESISGSYSGIVGLPLNELNTLLKHVDLNWL